LYLEEREEEVYDEKGEEGVLIKQVKINLEHLIQRYYMFPRIKMH
jgi:hypothetical protein